MSDYKGIFSQEYIKGNTPNFGIYDIKVIHKLTKEVVWVGQVEATTAKKAQLKWRKEYANIRQKYDQSYCLIITRYCSI